MIILLYIHQKRYIKMALFNKKEGKNKNVSTQFSANSEEAPKLPELPRMPSMEQNNFQENEPQLPELPEAPLEEEQEMPLQKLPSYPSNNTGKQFSQNTIKEAVSRDNGEPEEERFHEAPGQRFETTTSQNQMLQQPPQTPQPQMPQREFTPQQMNIQYSRLPQEKKYTQKESKDVIKKEPLFVRIDKFEESLDEFKNIKEQVSNVEETLKKIKETKEKEEKEMNSWEEEIKNIKEHVEKIDKDVFSKI